MADRFALDRRDFLKTSVTAGTALLIGFRWSARAADPAEEQEKPQVNPFDAWVRITPENHITLILGKSEMGQGIMTAIVPRLCEFAFAELGLVKIVAQVFAGNAASAKVLEKSGFVQEGYLREHHLKDGKYLDARLFALLEEPASPG